MNGSIGEIKFGEIELGVRREELNKFGMPFDPELTADGLISDCGIIKNKGTKKNLCALRGLGGEKLRIAELKKTTGKVFFTQAEAPSAYL